MAVWPVIPPKQQPGGYSDDWNKSTIMISLNKPAPPEGCAINFSVEPVKDSGEHIEDNHTGTRQTGSVSPSVITFPGGSPGSATVVYTSTEVSGVDKIIIETDDGKTKKVIREEMISVRVPGLDVELGEGEGYDLMPQPDKGHPYNHFGKLDTFTVLWDIADIYFETENGILRINDISLPLGGAFDICGKWDPKLTCDTYKKGGHNTHRLGEDVDVDDETTEKKTVTEDSLKKIIKDLELDVTVKDEGNHFHLSISLYRGLKKLPPPPPPDIIPQ
ncbi:MAG: hypothetical protein WA277_12010 [Nitrospirota bacterium]